MRLSATLFAGMGLLISAPSFASELNAQLGVGYPYLLTPGVSYQPDESDSRYTLEYKMGLDDGFALSWDTPLDAQGYHRAGLVIGALGARDARDCEQIQQDDPDAVDNIGSQLGHAIGCALLEVFDDETTNGLGFTYQYHFSGQQDNGWFLQFVGGYGETSDTNLRRWDGSFSVQYRF